MKRREYIRPLDTGFKERIRIKLDIDKGQLLSFVVQYESFINDKWVAIVRYDCAHGYFHRDILSPKGEQNKKKISIFDLTTASLYAEQDINDRWEWYKEQYLKKLKKWQKKKK